MVPGLFTLSGTGSCGATGYIIPFMFVYGPSILLIGHWSRVALTVVTATVGVVCLAAGMTGFLFARASVVERLMLVAAARRDAECRRRLRTSA